MKLVKVPDQEDFARHFQYNEELAQFMSRISPNPEASSLHWYYITEDATIGAIWIETVNGVRTLGLFIADPAYRHRGLGRQAIMAIMTRHPGGLRLHVRVNNTPAIRLYHACGFRMTDCFTKPNGVCCYEMKRLLVVFDIDDTLYDLSMPFALALKDLFGDRPLDTDALFQRSRVHSDALLPLEKQGRLTHDASFIVRMKRTFEEDHLLVTEAQLQFFATRYRHYQEGICCFAFVPRLIGQCLSAGMELAILTNGPEATQKRKAQVLGLDRWFDETHIFISGVIGAHKPETAAFDDVRQTLGYDADACVYVGDTYETDIRGAHQASWRTLWFNHRHRMCPDPVSVADWEVDQGQDVFETLMQENKNFIAMKRANGYNRKEIDEKEEYLEDC